MDHLLNTTVSLAFSILRPFGVLVLLPIFSVQSLGGYLIRNAVIIIFALPIVPLYHALLPEHLASSILLVPWCARELFIGMLIGFSAAISFWAIDIASHVLDTMRGASMGTLLNPLLGEASSIFGMLFSQLYALIFMAFGGMHQMLSTLYQSYNILPPGHSVVINEKLLSLLETNWILMLHLGLSFALPAILIMLLVDIAMGMLNRSAQQLNVFFLAMPIKSILTLLLLIMSLESALQIYKQHTQYIICKVLSLLGANRE